MILSFGLCQATLRDQAKKKKKILMEIFCKHGAGMEWHGKVVEFELIDGSGCFVCCNKFGVGGNELYSCLVSIVACDIVCHNALWKNVSWA